METMVRPPRTGLEAFELLPEGTLCQLINDAIIMSPAPTPNHQKTVRVINKQILRFVEKEDLGELLFAPVDVYLDGKNVFQPDIVFVSKQSVDIINWSKGIIGAPDLVIEILSADRKADLITKKKVYEQCGVKEYWVVDPLTNWCEGFELKDGTYHSLGEANGTMALKLLPLIVSF